MTNITLFHGTNTSVPVVLDLAHANPGCEHGRALYFSVAREEATKYGSNMVIAQFVGKIFVESLPTAGNHALFAKISRALARFPGVDRPLLAQRDRLLNNYWSRYPTVGSALEELIAALPDRQNSFNEILKKFGYAARQYHETSGKLSVVVIDPTALAYVV